MIKTFVRLSAAAGLLLAYNAHAVPLERTAPMPISQPVEQEEAETFESLPPDPAISSGLSSDGRGVTGTPGRTQGQLAYTLDDASLQLLPQPEALEDKIHFWESIYLRHGSDHVVIHDRESQAVIWRVVELPKLPSGAVDEKAGKIEVAAQLVDLKERLNRLATTLTAQDDEDRALLMLAGDGTISHLDGAADRLRTQRGVADKFALAQPRAAKLRSEIEKTLVEEGVPKELAMLPFIESMFNPQARSSVGALGLWQLMPGTAKWLGLTVTKKQDDRLDTVKATRAAAKLLRKNYELLGTWPLAITAYNHGQNGLKRAVEEAGTTDLVYLVTSYSKENWGFSSKNFYAGFLAACRSFKAVEQSHLRSNGIKG